MVCLRNLPMSRRSALALHTDSPTRLRNLGTCPPGKPHTRPGIPQTGSAHGHTTSLQYVLHWESAPQTRMCNWMNPCGECTGRRRTPSKTARNQMDCTSRQRMQLDRCHRRSKRALCLRIGKNSCQYRLQICQVHKKGKSRCIRLPHKFQRCTRSPLWRPSLRYALRKHNNNHSRPARAGTSLPHTRGKSFDTLPAGASRLGMPPRRFAVGSECNQPLRIHTGRCWLANCISRQGSLRTACCKSHRGSLRRRMCLGRKPARKICLAKVRARALHTRTRCSRCWKHISLRRTKCIEDYLLSVRLFRQRNECNPVQQGLACDLQLSLSTC
mmetsp:Transcript_94744/g.267480  ORF Transcript_94744/g.267480 Transcript_94744/m.267480 type:complete len:328 (-) Transcript_94744:132-1115(-)